MILSLYRGLTTIARPVIEAYLQRRMRRGKEEQARFGERMGMAGLPRPAGRLVWIHAASVGEAMSMLEVSQRLQSLPDTTVLMTSGTVTSAELMGGRLPKGAIHQYVPVDRVAWVRRFLDHWRPDLALWSESEFWPNLLVETADRGVPVVLLNGRVSDKSFKSWSRLPGLSHRLMSCFALAIAQTQEDAQRLSALGVRRVACHGNLKFAAQPLPADPAVLDGLRTDLAGRLSWLAASTHAGEEALAGRVHLALRREFPGLLTLVVPRHPERGPEIAAELAEMGLSVARRAAGQSVGAETDILLADTLGELGLFMRLAPIVLMGKSLIGQGGQNPLEPARLGASVLFGPWMENFAAIAGQMLAAGAATQVVDEAELTTALSLRLADPAQLAGEGARARAFASAQDGILDAVMDELQPWLA